MKNIEMTTDGNILTIIKVDRGHRIVITDVSLERLSYFYRFGKITDEIKER